MREIPLANCDKTLLVDDADYELISSYGWYFYNYPRRRSPHGHGGFLKGRRPGGHYVYLTTLLFSTLDQHVTMVMGYKDGNIFNWQRDNLLIFNNARSRGTTSTVSTIAVPHCPFGPATLIPAPDDRSDECLRCDDTFNGPYFHCLNQVRRTYWRGWKRIPTDDND